MGITNNNNNNSITNNNKLFKCSELFEFKGDMKSNCQWLNKKQVIIYPNDEVYPDSNFTIRSNKIKAECISPASDNIPCSDLKCINENNNNIIIIQYPIEPIKPIVSISYPSVINSCDSLILDISGSTIGSGGRAWNNNNRPIFDIQTIPNDINVTKLLNFFE